jgi:muramidase (phage lysozyme)
MYKRITQRILPSALLTAATFLNPEQLGAKTRGGKSAARTALKKPNLNDPDAFLRLPNPTAYKNLLPQERAFLDTIAYAEGTHGPNGYRMLYTGRIFKNRDVHPRKKLCGGGWCSTAAGRYQILWKTEKTIPITGFDPQDQDKEALHLIERRGARDDVRNARQKLRFMRALSKCNDEWASFPGSPHGQPTRGQEELWQYFQKRYMGYAQAKMLHSLALGGKKVSIVPPAPAKPGIILNKTRITLGKTKASAASKGVAKPIPKRPVSRQVTRRR